MTALTPRQRVRQIDSEIVRASAARDRKRAEANAIRDAIHDAEMEIRDTVDAAHRIIWKIDHGLAAMDAPMQIAATYLHDRLPDIRPHRLRLDGLRASIAPEKRTLRAATAAADDADLEIRQLYAERAKLMEELNT